MSDSETPPVAPAAHLSARAFADFPVSADVLAGIVACGYTQATPVQARTIDPALAGKDLLVRAKTGTGKTAAFCIPTIERIPAGDRKVRALMLTPTRELAVQVAQECANLAKFKDLRILTIYGGVGFGPQEDALRDGVEIVVGTPGRVLDHIRRRNLVLDDLMVAVLDEADEMLSMGFLEDVKRILDKTPKTRQNLLFSATVDDGIKSLIRAYLTEPEEVFLSYDGDNVSTITHILYETSPDYHKARALLDLIEQEKPSSAIIFCNTKEDVGTVYTYLDRQGLGVEMLSGDLPQKQRERVMARMKAGAVQFLVSTDVAARGIDISELSHVINYSLPDDAAVYLHRCGRTGRIGNTGVVINLAGGQDFSTRLTLTRQHKIDFEVKHLPDAAQSALLRTERVARMVADAAGSTTYEAWLDVVRAMKERPDADKLFAVMLKSFLGWDRQRRIAMADASAGEEDGGERREGENRDADRGDRAPDRGRDRDRGRGRGDRDRGRGGDRGPDRGRRDDRPRDDRPREDRPAGDRARDDRPREDRPREDRPAGDRPAGDRPAGDRPAGDRARSDRPAGDRTRSDRPREDRPAGDRPRSDRPRTERPPRREEPKAEGAEPKDEELMPPVDTAEASTDAGAPADAEKKKRRRRRRRTKGAGEAAGAEGTAAEGAEAGTEGGGDAWDDGGEG